MQMNPGRENHQSPGKSRKGKLNKSPCIPLMGVPIRRTNNKHWTPPNNGPNLNLIPQNGKSHNNNIQPASGSVEIGNRATYKMPRFRHVSAKERIRVPTRQGMLLNENFSRH